MRGGAVAVQGSTLPVRDCSARPLTLLTLRFCGVAKARLLGLHRGRCVVPACARVDRRRVRVDGLSVSPCESRGSQLTESGDERCRGGVKSWCRVLDAEEP